MGRPLRSLPAPADVQALVVATYDLPASGVTLLRTLVNDVYRIDSAAGPRVLKIYRHGRAHADVAWEARLANHLADGGVPVVRAHPTAGTFDAPEGERAYLLWEWAPGALPGARIDDDVAAEFGRTVAALHATADAGGPPPPSRERDLPIAALHGVLEPADRQLLDLLAAALPERIAGAALDRGICHGDVSLDNVHVDGGRLVLYDLDRATVDYRAADLTGVATTPWWPAFLAGYRATRELADADLAALPWLRVRELIANLHFHLVDKPTFRGTDSIGEGWAERELSALRAAAGRLLA
ncbi:phosphotransferase [Asanoa sp. WMMD1127]|uniref:phosphotransferase enzyme family protein n=1 Tax=Asanoa sp. WMMD1127 TaxID=3016107 RepID=UPI0024178543|nr:phosphotransferase [Asanoa sp. WMMD1127]MDG4824353.1 phosphotransferase [Asanoa sp. WMMD1127]